MEIGNIQLILLNLLTFDRIKVINNLNIDEDEIVKMKI